MVLDGGRFVTGDGGHGADGGLLLDRLRARHNGHVLNGRESLVSSDDAMYCNVLVSDQTILADGVGRKM